MRPEDIIISQIKTEKAQRLREQNQYVFKVHPKANKIQIKEAIEKIFNVKVKKVRTIEIPPKKRTFRGIEGKKPGFKKAIVILEKGQKIEIK
jgi:large subunit ribosomal protein L23